MKHLISACFLLEKIKAIVYVNIKSIKLVQGCLSWRNVERFVYPSMSEWNSCIISGIKNIKLWPWRHVVWSSFIHMHKATSLWKLYISEKFGVVWNTARVWACKYSVDGQVSLWGLAFFYLAKYVYNWIISLIYWWLPFWSV